MMCAEPAKKSGKLPSLDAARFFAALLVTVFHAAFTIEKFYNVIPFYGMFRGGHAGVEYFFVLSGFIIYYAHRCDLSRPKSIAPYFRKRASRILPMLWLTLLVWSLLRAALAGQATNAPTPWVTLIFDMLLLPHDGPLILGVTWTLQRELIFYALFAIALWNRKIGMSILLGWQLSILTVSLFWADLDPWLTAIFDIQNIGFGIGLLIAISLQRLRQYNLVPILPIGMFMFTLLLILEWYIGGPFDAEFRPLGKWLSPVLYTIAAAAILVGLIAKDQRTNGRANAVFTLLGGASYVLYLVHGPVGSVMVRIATRLYLPLSVGFALIIIAPICVAVVLHIWVEKPILRWLRQMNRVETARVQTQSAS